MRTASGRQCQPPVSITPRPTPRPADLDRYLRAFRRIVSENYDYRCAASGWRIILPEGRVMVEAANVGHLC